MPTQQTLWCFSIYAKHEDEEAIRSEVFAVTGAAPVVHSRPHAKTVRIECYFDSLSRVRDARRQLAHFSPRVQTLPYEDWAESWKKHFHVQRIGKRIVIKPSWRSHRPRRNDIVIELDPGMSFGTGQHPTTRFCLKMIERTAPRPLSLLDVGTGSGILAIAAAKLGYSPVLALDNDPQAVRVAKQNARNNRVRYPIRTLPLDALTSSSKFDVVAANLLADIILDNRRKLASLVAPGGCLLLAGILAKEASTVRRAFRVLGFRTFACEIRRNWAGFAFRKSNKRVPR